MPITRNSQQGLRQSIEAFYQEIADEETQQYGATSELPGAGRTMLQLLARLNELFPATQLWGLTSLHHLIMQSADNWQADWLMRLTASIGGAYYVEYLLPPDRQPWPGAYVRGEAPTLAEAERYLLIAMRECGGWSGNTELAARLTERGLT